MAGGWLTTVSSGEQWRQIKSIPAADWHWQLMMTLLDVARPIFLDCPVGTVRFHPPGAATSLGPTSDFSKDHLSLRKFSSENTYFSKCQQVQNTRNHGLGKIPCESFNYLSAIVSSPLKVCYKWDQRDEKWVHLNAPEASVLRIACV